MDRIKRRAEAFERFFRNSRLPDMVTALVGHWAGERNLDPFFVWSGEGVTFADHVGQLVAHFDGPAKDPGMADLLLLLTLETAVDRSGENTPGQARQGWHWEAGPRLLDDILAIMRIADDRAAGDPDRGTPGRDYAKHRPVQAVGDGWPPLVARSRTDLFDGLCDRTADPLPDLMDPTTAALFGNACAMLFHSRRNWHNFGSADGRRRLAHAAAFLLEEDWDLAAIRESCRAAIMPWVAWRIVDQRKYLSKTDIDALWNRVSCGAALPSSLSHQELLRYSLARSYHDIIDRFDHVHVLPAPRPEEDAPVPTANALLAGASTDRAAWDREIDRLTPPAPCGDRRHG